MRHCCSQKSNKVWRSTTFHYHMISSLADKRSLNCSTIVRKNNLNFKISHAKLGHHKTHISRTNREIFTNSWSMTNKKRGCRSRLLQVGVFRGQDDRKLFVNVFLLWIIFSQYFKLKEKTNQNSHLSALAPKLCRRYFQMWYRSADDHYSSSLIQCFVTFLQSISPHLKDFVLNNLILYCT